MNVSAGGEYNTPAGFVPAIAGGAGASSPTKTDPAILDSNEGLTKSQQALRTALIFAASTIAASITGVRNAGAAAGSGFGSALGSAFFTEKEILGFAGGPIGALLGGIGGGILGGLFGRGDTPEAPIRSLSDAVKENTTALNANTNALNELDASVLNAPTDFFVPKFSGSGSSISIEINAPNTSATDIANEVARIISDEFSSDQRRTTTKRSYFV